jgi:putative transposase
MDGKGRCMDNIFIERLWRSVKYEKIFLEEFETVPELLSGLKEYFEFYNFERPHQSLVGKSLQRFIGVEKLPVRQHD